MATMTIEQQVEEIKRKPYERVLVQEDDGTWFIKIAELPGCMSVGDTVDDAMEMIDDAMTAWLSVAIEHGDPIPPPATEETFSGKTMVRLGKDLHRLAALAAERDGVSLNHFITTQVARGVGASGEPRVTDKGSVARRLESKGLRPL